MVVLPVLFIDMMAVATGIISVLDKEVALNVPEVNAALALLLSWPVPGSEFTWTWKVITTEAPAVIVPTATPLAGLPPATTEPANVTLPVTNVEPSGMGSDMITLSTGDVPALVAVMV